MDLYKDTIIYKILKRVLYIFVSLITLSIYVFINHSNVYASSAISNYARCNLQIQSNTYFANAKIVIQTSNGEPLPNNLIINPYTNSCTNGFDNGSFLTGNADAQNWAISTSTQGPLSSKTNLTYAQLSQYYPNSSNPPTLYQNFGNINVGNYASVTPVNCPSNFGCNISSNPYAPESGYYSVSFNSNGSAATLTFFQVIDCGYSYLNYYIGQNELPSGWTINGQLIEQNGFTGQIPVVNSTDTPVSTITISPPSPPPTPTITKSCHNASGSKCSHKVHKKKHTSAPPSTKTPNPTISCSNGICSTTPVCGVNSLLNCTNPTIPTSTGSTLTINGSIVGYGGIYSFRDLGGGDITTPAVSIVFNPDFLSVYNELFISNLGDVIQYWIEPGI